MSIECGSMLCLLMAFLDVSLASQGNHSSTSFSVTRSQASSVRRIYDSLKLMLIADCNGGDNELKPY